MPGAVFGISRSSCRWWKHSSPQASAPVRTWGFGEFAVDVLFRRYGLVVDDTAGQRSRLGEQIDTAEFEENGEILARQLGALGPPDRVLGRNARRARRGATVSSRVIGTGAWTSRRSANSIAATGEAGPKVLVSNFSADEVREAVDISSTDIELPGASRPVDIVVASDEVSDEMPERFRLRADRSLTWHRNNSSNGLVLVLLAQTTDRQGLGQMFRITDRSILERRMDGSHAASRLLVEEAWHQAGDGGLT